MIYQLPTRSPRKYRGKYPRRVNSWSYSRSPSQQAIADYLDIRLPVHLELNDGTRFIACMFDFADDLKLSVEFNDILPGPVLDLPQHRYDEMLALVQAARA